MTVEGAKGGDGGDNYPPSCGLGGRGGKVDGVYEVTEGSQQNLFIGVGDDGGGGGGSPIDNGDGENGGDGSFFDQGTAARGYARAAGGGGGGGHGGAYEPSGSAANGGGGGQGGGSVLGNEIGGGGGSPGTGVRAGDYATDGDSGGDGGVASAEGFHLRSEGDLDNTDGFVAVRYLPPPLPASATPLFQYPN